MFEAGEVVRFFSPTAGKEKFHLCLGLGAQGPLFAFLHLNSGSGFKGDCVLDDGQIPGLPKSPTGKTIVSFSMIVRMGADRLGKFGAVKTGKISSELAGELIAFVKETPVVSRSERDFLLATFEAILET